MPYHHYRHRGCLDLPEVGRRGAPTEHSQDIGHCPELEVHPKDVHAMWS